MVSQIDYDSQEHIYTNPPEPAELPNMISIILSFIKNIRLGQDMTRISTPVEIDKAESALEMIIDSGRFSNDILNLYKETDPVKRITGLTKGIVSNVLRVTLEQGGRPGRKPYNPILGEQFHAVYIHSDGSQTVSVAEQVCHHPPISARFTYNAKHNIVSEYVDALEAVFKGTHLAARIKGYNAIHLFLAPDGKRETYTLVFPANKVSGFLRGKPKQYIDGDLIVKCESTGLGATINIDELKIEGSIYELHPEEKKKKHQRKDLLKVVGTGPDPIYITDLKTNEKTVFIDPTAPSDVVKYVKPVAQQHELETRRVWHEVTYGIRIGDFESARKAKSELEERQRRKAKEAKESGTEFKPVHFIKTDEIVDGVPVFKFKDSAQHLKYTPEFVEEKIDDEID